MVQPSEATYGAAVKMMREHQLMHVCPDDALGAPSPYVWFGASGREVQRFVIRREAHPTKQIHHVWRGSDDTYLGYMIHLWDPTDSSSLWSLHPGRAFGQIVTPLGAEVIAVSYREGISILTRPQKKWRTRRCGPPESPMVHLRTPTDAQWFPRRGDRRIDVSTLRCWQVLRCEGPRIHVTWWNHGSTRTHFKVFNVRTWAQTHRGHAYIPALVVEAPVKAPQDNAERVKVHRRALAAAELVQDLLAAGRVPDERVLQELVQGTVALHNGLLLPVTTLDRILDMTGVEHVAGQYTNTDMEALLGRIRGLLARWTVDDRGASEVPVHLLRALASATGALTAGEYHKLGTIEHEMTALEVPVNPDVALVIDQFACALDTDLEDIESLLSIARSYSHYPSELAKALGTGAPWNAMLARVVELARADNDRVSAVAADRKEAGTWLAQVGHPELGACLERGDHAAEKMPSLTQVLRERDAAQRRVEVLEARAAVADRMEAAVDELRIVGETPVDAITRLVADLQEIKVLAKGRLSDQPIVGVREMATELTRGWAEVARLEAERKAIVKVLKGEGNSDVEEPLEARVAAVLSDAIPGPRYTPEARWMLLGRVERAETAQRTLRERVTELLQIAQKRWDVHRERVDALLLQHDKDLAWSVMEAWCDGLQTGSSTMPLTRARSYWARANNSTRTRLLEKVGAALTEVEQHLQGTFT